MRDWKTFERANGIVEIYEVADYRELGSKHIATVYGLQNVSRIVACVNACEGIPNAVLQAGNGISDAIRHYQKQRDELLSALKRLSAQCDRMRLPGQPKSDAEKATLEVIASIE